MNQPIHQALWELTRPAIRAARARTWEYIESGKYVPRKAVTTYQTNTQGWSTTTLRDQFFPAKNGPVEWENMFGYKVGTFTQIAVDEVPALAFAAERVCEIAATNKRFEQSIGPLARGEPGSEKRKQRIKFEYMRFVADIISRAEAMGVSSDDDLLAIYLQLERARFAEELRGDLLVPIALTALDLDEPFEIADGLWIELLDEQMQRARATSAMYNARFAHVVAAATHAVVVRDITVDNHVLFDRWFGRIDVDLSRVDRVIQCLHIMSGRETGYAQAVVRPTDWADDWEHDLPAVWKAGQYHCYPDEFDNGGWTQEKTLVPRADIDSIPRMFAALEAAPANVRLAARRAIRAVLRSDDEDETLDAAIGIEALLLGNNDRDEMTHRMAQRAAAALASGGYNPFEVYRLTKRFYEHRSAIGFTRSSHSLRGEAGSPSSLPGTRRRRGRAPPRTPSPRRRSFNSPGWRRWSGLRTASG